MLHVAKRVPIFSKRSVLELISSADKAQQNRYIHGGMMQPFERQYD